MKKNPLILLVFIIFSFLSCSQNNDENLVFGIISWVLILLLFRFLFGSSKNDSNSRNVKIPTSNYTKPKSVTRDSSNNSLSVCRDCGGTGKCRECNKPFKLHYWARNGWQTHNETRLGLIMCQDCRGSGLKYGIKAINDKNPPVKPCHVSRCHGGWMYCNTCNPSGNGRYIGQCQRGKGTGRSR